MAIWPLALASNILVGDPPNPKDLGFGVLIPIPVLLVPSIWPKSACVMPNWKSDLPGYLARKSVITDFLS